MRKLSLLTVFFMLSGMFLLPAQVDARGGFLKLASQALIARSFSVSLAADTPIAANIVKGAKNVPVLKLNFSSQGSEKAILQRLVLSRFGVSQDSDIERAYLYDMNDNLLATAQYLSGRYIFSDVGFVVGSEEKSLMVKIDLAEDATEAGTLGVQVPSQLSILAAGSRTGLKFPVKGSFPIKGSEFTIVDVPVEDGFFPQSITLRDTNFNGIFDKAEVTFDSNVRLENLTDVIPDARKVDFSVIDTGGVTAPVRTLSLSESPAGVINLFLDESMMPAGNVADQIEVYYTDPGDNQVIERVSDSVDIKIEFGDAGGAQVDEQGEVSLLPELDVSKNAAYPDQFFIPGQTNFKLGSFVLQAGASENIVITSIAIMVDIGDDDRGSPENDQKITNLKLFQVGGNPDGSDKQFGVTQGMVLDYFAYGFAGPQFVLNRNESLIFDVYGDIHSSLFNNVVVKIPPGGIYAYGEETQFSLVAPQEWVDLQRAQAVAAGTLTVKTAIGNPPAKQFVAGTGHNNADNEIYRLELTASAVENLFVNGLVFRLDQGSDNVAVRELALYDQRGAFLAAVLLVRDAELPGYFSFSFAGQERIEVPKGETIILGVRAGFTSSHQGAVSGKTPQIHVVSVEAEGINEVVPHISNGFVDSIANLDAGQDDSGCNLNEPAGINATQTSFQVDSGGAGVCSLATVPAGVLLTIDSEDMLVLSHSDNTFTLVRGMNNTVPVAHVDNLQFNYGGMTADMRNRVLSVDDSSMIKAGQMIRLGFEQMETALIQGDLLFVTRAVNNTFLERHTTDDEAVMEAAALESNEMMVMKTLPVILPAFDSPSGGTNNPAKTDDVLAKFVVTAESNPADPSQNAVEITRLRVTPNAIGMSLDHLQLYPAERDNNAAYAIPGEWKGPNLVEFDLWRDPEILRDGYDEVLEGTTKSFVLRGSTNSNTNGSYRMKIRPLGSSSDAVYGSSSNFEWSDGVITTAWVDQAGGEAVLNPAAVGFASHGIVDTTAPVITSVVFGGVANNVLGVSDTIAIGFSEAMSPGTLAAEVATELRPDNLDIQVKEGGTADVSLATTAVMSVKNLLTVDVDNQNAASASEYSVLARLNSTANLLTLTLAVLTQGNGALSSSEELTNDGTQAAGFAFDQAGNAMVSGAIPNAVIMGDI